MRLLIDDGILELAGKVREPIDKGSDVKILGRGRLSEQYRIRRNLRNIKKIYLLHPGLEGTLRATDWVYDVILLETMNLDAMENVREQDRQYLKGMLRVSPSFFNLCLIAPLIQQTALRWSSIRNNQNLKPLKPPSKHVIHSIQLHQYPFHAYLNLFIFCLFLDETYGGSTEEEYKILETIQKIWVEKERDMKNWDRDRIKRAAMIDTVRQVVNRSSDEPDLMKSLEAQISRYDTEEKEYNKMESNMLSGKHELTPDMVDASVTRREWIMSGIIDLLELESIFTPS